jgi:hypothetical protein
MLPSQGSCAMSATNHPESLASDLLAAWQHLEVLVADDKNKMIATVSWLIGVSVALTTAAVAELVDSEGTNIEGTNYFAVYALTIGAIVLEVLATFFVRDFALHAVKKYGQADKVREEYKNINPSNVDLFFGKTYLPRKRYILSCRVGLIFDICLGLSILALIASFAVLLWAWFR